MSPSSVALASPGLGAVNLSLVPAGQGGWGAARGWADVCNWTELENWAARVRLMVKPKRYEHVCRVAQLAYEIAVGNSLGAECAARAYAAGILHDVARDLPDAELLRLAPPECAIDEQHPLALHGRAARRLLERWGYADRVVLEAVEDHTTGPRAGQVVSACVYIADVSEPGRGVNHDIRELALTDLGAALERAIVAKVNYLQRRGIQVHPRTLECYRGLSRSVQAHD